MTIHKKDSKINKKKEWKRLLFYSKAKTAFEKNAVSFSVWKRVG